MASFRTDLTFDSPSASDGGTDVWIFVRNALKPTSIAHGLGRQPTRCWIVDSDKDCRVYRTTWDNQRAVLLFTATDVNLVLRFE